MSEQQDQQRIAELEREVERLAIYFWSAVKFPKLNNWESISNDYKRIVRVCAAESIKERDTLKHRNAKLTEALKIIAMWQPSSGMSKTAQTALDLTPTSIPDEVKKEKDLNMKDEPNRDAPFPRGHRARMQREQEQSMLANQVVGAEVLPPCDHDECGKFQCEKDKDAMLAQLTNTVTDLCLAIDPTATHGPETEKIVAYCKQEKDLSEERIDFLNMLLAVIPRPFVERNVIYLTREDLDKLRSLAKKEGGV